MNAIDIARALGLEDCGDGCSCHGSWSEEAEERVDVAVHESFDPDPRFCPDCLYLWSLHDNRIAGRSLPFGCPRDEAEAAMRWGRE